MRKFTTILALVLTFNLTLFVSSCKRLELYELTTNVDLQLKIDLQINMNLNMQINTNIDKEFTNLISGVMPEYMEVLFYDPVTHKMKTSHIMPISGGQLSIAPGNYDVVAYSFGTESTQVDHLGNRDQAEAFTSNITKMMSNKFKGAIANAAPMDSSSTKSATKGYEDDPIIYAPDHLYVANENSIEIPSFLENDDTVFIHATARTILDVYSLEVLGVAGCENIEKVEAFITGQIRSNYFGIEKRSSDPATIYITMKTDAENGRLYTVFGTFGKLAGVDNKVYLDITVTNTDGGQYRYVYDVTDQFEDNSDNSLIIRDEIDIPSGPTGGGGLAPEVGEWNEEIYDIPLS